MKFLSFDLGSRRAGESMKVTLSGTAANVMLLDELNLSSYRAGRAFSYFGGHATRSPVFLRIPRPDRWHVVVDLGGGRGNVSANVEVIG